jgi:hypothetical protein
LIAKSLGSVNVGAAKSVMPMLFPPEYKGSSIIAFSQNVKIIVSSLDTEH